MENFEHAIKNFRKYLVSQKKRKSDNTVTAYIADVKDFLSNINIEISKINVDDINKYLNKLSEVDLLSSKTISRRINSLRSFFNYLLKDNLINNNPGNNVEHPSFSKRKQRFLSHEDCTKIRQLCQDKMQLYTMIELLLQTGIKISELSELMLNDVHIQNGDNFIEIYSKQAGYSRTIPLNNRIKFALMAYIQEFHKKHNKPLFYTSTGRRINVRNIRAMIDEALMESDLTGITVNDFRNTFIIRQLQSGMALEKLAAIVGHTSLAATKKYLAIINGEYTPNEKITNTSEV